MNKSVIAGVVVIIALLVAGYFSGYLGFLGGENLPFLARQPDSPIIIFEGLQLSSPVLLIDIFEGYGGTYEAEPNLMVPAFFFKVVKNRYVLAAAPGIISTTDHFLGGKQIKIASGDYQVSILVMNATLDITENSYIGPSVPLGKVNENVPGTEANLVIFVKNNSDTSYVNVTNYLGYVNISTNKNILYVSQNSS